MKRYAYTKAITFEGKRYFVRGLRGGAGGEAGAQAARPRGGAQGGLEAHARARPSVLNVPIPEKLAQRLEMEHMGAFKPLLANGHGGQLTKSNMHGMWDQAKKDMHVALGGRTDYGGLRRIVPPLLVASDLVPYCPRHDYATRLQAAGVPINVAKELPGHSSIEMTARIYTHSSEESFENARRLMDEAEISGME